MSEFQIQRRSVIVGALIGSAGSAALAQDALSVNIDLDRVRDFHRSQMISAGETLGDSLALSQDGLLASLRRLTAEGLLPEADSSALETSIGIIFEAETLADIARSLRGFFADVVEQLSDLAKTVAGIIIDSVEYAQETISNIDHELVLRVIAHDIQGALTGAAAGATVGGWVPGLGSAAGAITGALLGGAADSVIGFFDSAKRGS